jgi:hypothetical protein
METLSIRKYAVHRGVSHVSVLKAIRAGRIERGADGSIDVQAADIAWEKNTNPGQRARQHHREATASPAVNSTAEASPNLEHIPESKSGAGSSLDYSKARAVRENYMARLAKIEFEERSNKLMSRDEVEVAAFKRYRDFRDSMLNIPDRVSSVLAAESDAGRVHALLSEEIRKMLSEFADAANRG